MKVLPRRETDALQWNRFVDRHAAGWWWHRTEWLDYCLAYDRQATDQSFALVDDDRVVGVCPAMERDGLVRMGDDPCAGFLVELGGDTGALMLPHIQTRLGGKDVAWRWNRYPSWSKETITALACLPGFSSSSWHTAVVGLVLGARSDRWAGVRKSYRSLIHKAERECDLETGAAYWPYYEACHRRTATRPRSDATYRHQEQWVKDGLAQVFVAFPKGRTPDCPLAASLVITYKHHAYYASGPSTQNNLQHALQWMAMQSLTVGGVKTYELGWVDRHGAEDSIGFFKNGFGGWLYSVDMVEGVLPV